MKAIPFPRASSLVLASTAVADEAIVKAIASELPIAGPSLPADIQWAPPGVHEIVATRNNQRAALRVVVDEDGAKAVQAQFLRMMADANAGLGNRPFLDFDHKNEASSGWPTGFFWGGSDPQRGGIRMRVDWSAPGAEAIRGRAYRSFSPAFQPDDVTGKIIGTAVNVGGLCNAAAFSRIQPIFAKHGGETVVSVATPEDFIVAAKMFGERRGISDAVDAQIAFATANPDSYNDYRRSLALGSAALRQGTVTLARVPETMTVEARSFIDAACVHECGRAVDETEACVLYAAERPDAYQRYRVALGLGPAALRQGPVTASSATGESGAPKLDGVASAEERAAAEEAANWLLEQHDKFMARVEELRSLYGLGFSQAAARVADEEPQLHRAYAMALTGGGNTPEMIAWVKAAKAA